MNHTKPPPSTTYTNQRVAFQTCLVFSWLVLSANGWMPVEHLDLEDLKMIRKEMDFNKLFPEELYRFIDRHIAALQPAAV